MIIEGEIRGLYVGNQEGLETTPVSQLKVDFNGVVGDKHAGPTRLSDSRNPKLKRGTVIPNDRQLSFVSHEELKLIAELMGVPYILASWLGANIEIEGVFEMTKLLRNSVLTFQNGTILKDAKVNLPCIGPGKVISQKFPELNVNPAIFPKNAMGNRGGIAVVKLLGIIKIGDSVKII